MKIIVANPDDRQVRMLSNCCFSELRKIYKPTQKAENHKQRSDSKWTTFEYYSDVDLQGCLKASLVKQELKIQGLAVKKEARRQGIARRLIEYDRLLYPSAEYLSLWCVQQTGNVEVFERIGFTIVESFESDFFELVDGSNATEVKMICKNKMFVQA